jgi:hypothetical protein
MKLFCLILLSGCSLFLSAAPAGKLILKTVEAAAKVSGKSLSPAARSAAVSALTQAVTKYGDEAIRITRQGGLETLKQGMRYGDEFWRAARHADPAALRSLALHTEELLPIAQRIGPAFLKLEAKVPGLGAKAVSVFGDDAVKALAELPADDTLRLLGLAQKSRKKGIEKMLLKAYSLVPDKEKFLTAFDWKKIMATGLSSAAVIAAYKLSHGAEEGLKTLAENDPERFTALISETLAPFKWLIFFLVLLGIFPLVRILWKWSMIKLPHRKKEEPGTGSSDDEQK